MKYTPAQLDAAALADLANDARCAEEQARTGPFYPDRGITVESLTQYATACREQIVRYQDGGLHAALVRA